jgi:colicin import membrane protein
MSSLKQENTTWRYLAISFGLHLVFFLALVISVRNSQVRLQAQSKINIVQAVAIDSTQVATQPIPTPTKTASEIQPVENQEPQNLAMNEPEPVPVQNTINSQQLKKEEENLKAETEKRQQEKEAIEAKKKQQEILKVEAEKKRQESLREAAEKQHEEELLRAEAEKQELLKLAEQKKKQEADKHADEQKKKLEKDREEALRLAAEDEEKQRLKLEKESKKKELNKLKKQRELEMAKVLNEQLLEEQKQLKAQAKEKKNLEKKQALAKLAKERKQAMAKAMSDQLQEEQNQMGQENSAVNMGEINKFKALILSSIAHHWLVPAGTNKDLSCQLLIHLGEGGVVLDVSVVKSSGDEVLDRSAQTAVIKASPLPVPNEPAKFKPFRELRLTVKPEQVTVR